MGWGLGRGVRANRLIQSFRKHFLKNQCVYTVFSVLGHCGVLKLTPTCSACPTFGFLANAVAAMALGLLSHRPYTKKAPRLILSDEEKLTGQLTERPDPANPLDNKTRMWESPWPWIDVRLTPARDEDRTGPA